MVDKKIDKTEERGVEIVEEIEEVEEEEKPGAEKDVTTKIPEEKATEGKKAAIKIDLSGWSPKTSIGKKVKSGEIKDIDEILEKGRRILEVQIIDVLLPDLKTELLFIGQSKGKFGGGQKRIFKQTQKKTPEGNKPSFACFATVGNENGYVGGGYGKSKDTVPSREKAIRNAKLNIFKTRRGCGSWECSCKEPHTIPFAVEGKCGSVSIRLMPAPKGKGLCIEEECGKILKLAGIKDVWSKTKGQTKVKINLIKACIKALRKLMEMKITEKDIENVGMIEGKIIKPEEE